MLAAAGLQEVVRHQLPVSRYPFVVDCTGSNAGFTASLDATMALSTYNRSTDSWFINGAPGGTRNIFLSIGGGELQVGSRLQPFTEGFTGHLAELIVFCTVLTEAERNALGFYIQEKYGIIVQDARLAGSLRIVSIDYALDENLPDTAHVTLRFTSREGGRYLIESGTDLNSWEDELNDNYPGTGDITEYVHTFSPASGATRRFYRISEN